MGDISMSANLGRRIFDGPIGFPGFNITLNPPQTLGNTPIHWYGVLIVLGLVLAVIMCIFLGKKHGVSEDTILDVVIIGAPSAIIGARIYYVAFRWDSYKDNLIDIFKIWEGGIAIYGAVIAAVLAGVIYCKVRKINTRNLLDVCIVGFPLGQAVGRWGNFVNREAFGAAAGSNIPWRMRLYTDTTMATWADVHPTFLYESLWNLGVLVLLIHIIGRKKFDGQVFLTYVMAYGIGRLWIEGLRTDSLYIGPLRISQLIALITAVAAAAILIIALRKVKNSQTIDAETPSGM